MEAANYGILSLIPLALTLLLAFWKKDAVFALFMGCLSGVLLLGHDPAFGSVSYTHLTYPWMKCRS